jgi:hypothetical protein
MQPKPMARKENNIEIITIHQAINDKQKHIADTFFNLSFISSSNKSA